MMRAHTHPTLSAHTLTPRASLSELRLGCGNYGQATSISRTSCPWRNSYASSLPVASRSSFREDSRGFRIRTEKRFFTKSGLRQSATFRPLPGSEFHSHSKRSDSKLVCFSVSTQNDALENFEDAANPSSSSSSSSSTADADAAASSGLSEESATGVNVEVLGGNSRRIVAKVKIEAPLKWVWSTLTDYARLGEFIPSLTVNQLIERKQRGAVLLQMAEQEIGFGLKFKAKAVMEVEEVDDADGGMSEVEEKQRTIRFTMLEGDFKVFQGTWYMEKISGNPGDPYSAPFTLLTYGVEITPKRWLPVAIIEGRMAREIQMNLEGVKLEALNRFATSSPNC